MRNTLTVKQSRELVNMGLDPDRASYFDWVNDKDGVSHRVPIFMVTDLIQILREIKFEGYRFVIADYEEYGWRIEYRHTKNPIYVMHSVGNPELVDGLYYMMEWVLRMNHYRRP